MQLNQDKSKKAMLKTISPNTRVTMMENFIDKKIHAERVNLINLQDRNIAQYAKCAFRSMIIIACGIVLVM